LTSRLSISLLLLVAFAASAQKRDTVKQKHDFRPTGIRFGTDAIAIIKSATDKTFEGWEVNGDIDFYRYYFAADYGYWARNYTAYDAAYSNDGTYWRVGADVNFLTKDPDKNMYFFGLRYGASVFSEEMVIQKVDPVWGDISTTLTNSNVHAHWFEATTGLRVKMLKIIWMGYTVRLKFALDTDNTDNMMSSDVPGYGRADAESYWGFNYQIFIRIPVRKKDSIPLKK
jgi:hypothetical protein